MDDELRRKIAATLDPEPDAAAMRVAVQAMARDPEARAFERDLRVVDRALRTWPSVNGSPEAWDRALGLIQAGLDGAADPVRVARVTISSKAASGDAVMVQDLDVDPAAVPRFDDDPVPSMENPLAMSETNENDSDLESLAALTRTSTGPGAIPTVPPRALGASITDAVDDTSSGVVDIKHLARIARESVAAPPPAGGDEAKASSDARTADATAAGSGVKSLADLVALSDGSGKKDARPVSKATDVMVTAKPTVPVAAPAHPPSNARGGLWGAVAAFAVSAAAFGLYLKTQNNPALPEASAPASNAAETAPTAAAPAPVVPVAQQPAAPEGMPAQGPSPATAAPQNTVAPVAPAPEAAPGTQPQAVAAVGASTTTVVVPPAPPPMPGNAQAAAHAATADLRGTTTRTPAPSVPDVAHDTAGERGPAAHRAHGAAEGDHPALAAAHAEAPTTAAHSAAGGAAGHPTAAAAPTPPASAPTPAPAAPAPAAAHPATGPRSIDDLLNSAAPSRAAAAPAAAATASGPSAELPERLNRSQVSAVMAPLNTGARACTQGQPGTAPVSITINSDGTVRSATVSGQFAGTPAGDCIAGLVQRAHFPAFRQASSTIMFPFVITPPR